MNARYIGIAIAVILLGGFGYWAIAPLFINIRVDEALPESAQEIKPAMIKEIDAEALEHVSTSLATPKATSLASAVVTGTAGHPASGTVRIVSADGKNYVRYENFKTINGPDIYVYLAKDRDAKEYVNLGKVKATEGNINYEIPSDVNPDDYPYVLTWCKIFGILFNSAKLQ